MFQMEGDWRECGAFWETSVVGRVQRVMNESLEYHAEDLELCFEVIVTVSRGVTLTVFFRKITLAFGEWRFWGKNGGRSTS